MARILMLCHDQHLDRRVLAQAETLLNHGHDVRLLALSFDAESHEEEMDNGLQLVRIGLTKIVPENETYVAYMDRQYGLNDFVNKMANRFPRSCALFNRLFRWGSYLNWQLYRALLLLRYRNLSLHDPLPFRKAFYNQGKEFPSDLVQVHDLPGLEAGAQLADLWKVPLVYDAHELYPEQKSFSKVQRNICSRAEAEQIAKADLVFAVNDSIGEEMAKRYDIEKPITLLNAIDPPPSFDPLGRYNLLREKTGIPAQRRILLFQGGFSPNRNLEALIEAMAYVRTDDVDLVMMGFGAFGEFLKEKAKKLNLLDKRIYFIPAVSQDELLQHSASADMGIIPYPHVDLNSYYCTPNKLFEFIQAGLPILANDSPELNRFVRDCGFGYCAPMKHSKDIAVAIDTVFASEDLSKWQIALGERRIDLAWKWQGAIYKDAIENILQKKSVESSKSIVDAEVLK